MSFKEQERLLSDIKNLRRARRELFSAKIYLLCFAYVFSLVLVFNSFDFYILYKDRMGILFLLTIVIPLSLLVVISVFENLKVSAKKLISHEAISMLSSESLNELKNFVSSKLLNNKVLFIKKNELDLFISGVEKRFYKIKDKEYNHEFKNKVHNILNGKID